MKILRRGSAGPQVQLLQLALSRAGYMQASAIDGIFGSATANALNSFQKETGLIPDSVAGPLTWAELTKWLTGFFVHTISGNDTFYGLALKYGSTIQAIETANPSLDPVNLPIGLPIVIPLAFPVVPTNISVTSKMIDFCVRGLKARYPFLTTGRIGFSVLGSPLHQIDIGTGSNRVFFNAAHHSDEWITATLLLKYLEDYASAVASNGRIFSYSAEELYTGTTLSIVPLVNPDGVGCCKDKRREITRLR
jgi:g-D-glutamyl-meso-diaminopimelate peptidase